MPTADEVLQRVSHRPDLDDLLYVGGELSPESLDSGYRAGLFPMELGWDEDQDTIGWLSPKKRATMWLADWATHRSQRPRVTRSTRQIGLRYSVTIDTRFAEVVSQCAVTRMDGNWISAPYELAYLALFERGLGHSVEVWNGGQLVGGLFGIAVGGLFSGESMFHCQSGASKVALVALHQVLKDANFVLLDAQWITPHLSSLGFSVTDRSDYLSCIGEITHLSAAPVVPGQLEIDWERLR